MIILKKLGYQFAVMLLVGAMILIGQRIGKGTSIILAAPGMLMLIAAAMSAMLIKELFPRSFFPAFGWATIIGLLLSIPVFKISISNLTFGYVDYTISFISPTSKIFLSNVNNVDFMAITTPLLAFAGISVGNKINDLKAMSWKIVIVSVFTFTSIFFACAIIAQSVLKLQGKI